MLLADRLARIRQDQTGPAYDDHGDIVPDYTSVRADDLMALIAVVEATRALAAAADALLDVTVASTPNTRLSSVAKQIGALNRAWKEYRDADA